MALRKILLDSRADRCLDAKRNMICTRLLGFPEKGFSFTFSRDFHGDTKNAADFGEQGYTLGVDRERWAKFETNSPGPRPGMRLSKPVRDNTTSSTMPIGVVGK